MARLEGKVAFISGSGAGIGRAGAVLFAREGARVAVADIAREGGEETVKRIKEAGGEAFYLNVDMSDPPAVEQAFKTVVERYGKLDVLYNNAGASTTVDGPVTELPLEEWARAIRVNLFATFLGCKYGIPHLIRAGGGSVINTASVAGLTGSINGRHAYSAAKGGVVALTRAIAVDYAKDKVRANAVAPGVTLTERIRGFFSDPKFGASNDGKHLLGYAEPEDIASMALYLASDESRRITGVVIPVDSGYTAA
jgi:NAD(P)-dependent dehydrogenase (short-subunit alcohol dehydrogenase family)